jgi:hypothetical protein
MKATELRIGNMVYQLCKEIDSEVWCISRVGSVGKIYEIDHNIEKFRPIQLTEEWMNRLGLRTDGYSESYSMQIYSMQIGDGNYSSDGGNIIIINTQKYNDGKSYTGDGWLFCTLSTLTSDFDSYGFKARIKYVHQLQNLYFALTGGEELPINTEGLY